MSDTISPQSPVVDDGSSDGAGQKRLLLVVGGAALLLVLGLGAYFLFLSGGEEEDLGPVPSAANNQPTEDPVKKNKGSKKDKAPKDVKADFTVGRDPFVPLSVEAVKEPAPAPEEPTTDTGKTSGGTKSGGGTSTAPTTAPAPTSSPSPAPTQDAVTSYKVTLRSVDLKKNTAVIEVDGKRYLLKVKDMFTDAKTGPFKLTGVGERDSGKATAIVVFGSDAPVELLAKDTVVFKL
ncbi:MAG TPA: hypothetical protein VMX11_04065 [Actinomycetes bacterium]|nr:hypothetical protein [Actinomycetes bacterium]